MEVVQRPVIFPSVTICNKNYLDTLVVDKLDGLYEETNSASTKVNGDIQQFIQKYLAFSDNLSAFLRHSTPNMSLKQYHKEMSEVPVLCLL